MIFKLIMYIVNCFDMKFCLLFQLETYVAQKLHRTSASTSEPESELEAYRISLPKRL